MKRLKVWNLIFIILILTSNAYGQLSFQGVTVQSVVIKNYDYIIPVGDSITAGATATDCTGYRKYLYNDAGGAYIFRGERVTDPNLCTSNYGIAINPYYGYHCGYSGQRSDQILSFMSGCTGALPSTSGTRTFILMAGTNDISQDVAAATIVGYIKDIIDAIVAFDASARIYVCLLTPRLDDTGGYDTDTTTFNALLDNTVANGGVSNYTGVTGFIDLNTGYCTGCSGSGFASANAGEVHPNDEGYDWIAATIYSTIGSP